MQSGACSPATSGECSDVSFAQPLMQPVTRLVGAGSVALRRGDEYKVRNRVNTRPCPFSGTADSPSPTRYSYHIPNGEVHSQGRPRNADHDNLHLSQTIAWGPWTSILPIYISMVARQAPFFKVIKQQRHQKKATTRTWVASRSVRPADGYCESRSSTTSPQHIPSLPYRSHAYSSG